MPKQTKPLTQVQVIEEMVERTGFQKRQVKDFLAYLHDLMLEQLMGIGSFTFPALGIKATMVKKPATKARRGKNPFTGEEIMIAAKPARKVVKIRAMKALKDDVTPYAGPK